MHLITFNINGIRSHINQLKIIINHYKPDILCIQETRVKDNLFPLKEIEKCGYVVLFKGKKQHCGVATFLKMNPITVQYGLKLNDSSENKFRVITVDLKIKKRILKVINVYFPNGNNLNNSKKFKEKKIFYKKFSNFLDSFRNTVSTIIMGDMNVCPYDIDIGFNKCKINHWISKGYCSFLPEEKLWLKKIFSKGLIDVYRKMHPKKKDYSWFDYRFDSFNKRIGLRIDFILSSKDIFKYFKKIYMNYYFRTFSNTSDHVPIHATIDENLFNKDR
ncbi:MAG: exodeoxyribonuclease III [Enterobacteriaceae bacterium]